ncbi:MAG TPA: class I SAM-dependent methyltransferase, partial [Verrucomicrobiae bacterium]|nr:class I SAM-dependent methyltransferase [Verrucomicrobiae bacterium]
MTEDEQEIKTIATYDRTASHWTATHMIVNDWEQDAAKFKQFLPKGRVLEVGCGGGRDAAELLRLGYEYYGTDASKGMVEAARSEVPNGTFEVRSLYDLAELGQRFDGFWACAVLLHV